MPKELIQPKTVYKATSYSHAVKRGNIVFISGQVSKDAEGSAEFPPLGPPNFHREDHPGA